MPDQPDAWALVLAWLYQNYQTLYCMGLSATMAFLRVIYTGGSTRRSLLEGGICALLTTAILPLLEYFTLPSSLATPAAVFIGFMGVEKIRAYAERYADRKVPPV